LSWARIEHILLIGCATTSGIKCERCREGGTPRCDESNHVCHFFQQAATFHGDFVGHVLDLRHVAARHSATVLRARVLSKTRHHTHTHTCSSGMASTISVRTTAGARALQLQKFQRGVQCVRQHRNNHGTWRLVASRRCELTVNSRDALLGVFLPDYFRKTNDRLHPRIRVVRARTATVPFHRNGKTEYRTAFDVEYANMPAFPSLPAIDAMLTILLQEHVQRELLSSLGRPQPPRATRPHVPISLLYHLWEHRLKGGRHNNDLRGSHQLPRDAAKEPSTTHTHTHTHTPCKRGICLSC